MSNNNELEIDIGKAEFKTDGIGFNARASALSVKDTSGPVDISATLAQLNGGAKLADEHGLDAKIEATATLVESNVGPVNGSIGIGVDTGLKIGDDGVGVKFLGTGFQIGPSGFGISIFGSKFGINF